MPSTGHEHADTLSASTTTITIAAVNATINADRGKAIALQQAREREVATCVQVDKRTCVATTLSLPTIL
eukprot:m.15900 g.15900  ORF g.15900 m.15900 type:complete len:69 (+) comp5112_c0_seq2:3132-3338(+)